MEATLFCSGRKCGPHDKRLRSRRCFQCRRQHLKCEGVRPCLNCRKRQVDCEEMPPSITNGHVTLDSTPYISALALSSIPEQTYRFFIDRFFQHVGTNYSPFISVLSFSSVESIIKTAKPVCSAILALGARLASRDDRHFNADIRRDFAIIADRSYKEAWNYVQFMWNEHLQSANHVFLCAILLSIFELMADDSGIRWYSTMRGTLAKLVQHRGTQGFKGTLGESLLHLYWVCEGFRALSFDEDNEFADGKWLALLSQSESSRNKDEGHLAISLASLGRLNYRSIAWLQKSRVLQLLHSDQLTITSPTVRCNANDRLHLADGRGIVKDGFRVREEILEWAPELSAQVSRKSQSSLDLNMPMYYCCLVSVSRLFIDPVWLLTGEQLPLLAEDIIKSHSLAALTHIERRLKKVGIEAVFCLPMLVCISLEVQKLQHRTRILDCFEAIDKKGFSVARTVRSDIIAAWSVIKAGYV